MSRVHCGGACGGRSGSVPPSPGRRCPSLPGQSRPSLPGCPFLPGRHRSLPGRVPPSPGGGVPPSPGGGIPPSLSGVIPPSPGGGIPPSPGGVIPPSPGGVIPPSPSCVPPSPGGVIPPSPELCPSLTGRRHPKCSVLSSVKPVCELCKCLLAVVDLLQVRLSHVCDSQPSLGAAVR